MPDVGVNAQLSAELARIDAERTEIRTEGPYKNFDPKARIGDEDAQLQERARRQTVLV